MFIIYKKQNGSIATTYVNADAGNVQSYVSALVAEGKAPDLPWSNWIAVARSHPATAVHTQRIQVGNWDNTSSITIAPPASP